MLAENTQIDYPIPLYIPNPIPTWVNEMEPEDLEVGKIYLAVDKDTGEFKELRLIGKTKDGVFYEFLDNDLNEFWLKYDEVKEKFSYIYELEEDMGTKSMTLLMKMPESRSKADIVFINSILRNLWDIEAKLKENIKRYEEKKKELHRYGV